MNKYTAEDYQQDKDLIINWGIAIAICLVFFWIPLALFINWIF